MSAKQSELKELAAKKKELAAKAKTIREELKASAEDRNKARKARSVQRAQFTENKSKLRSLLAKSYATLKDGTSEEIAEYADEIIEITTAMAANVRQCSEAQAQLEEL